MVFLQKPGQEKGYLRKGGDLRNCSNTSPYKRTAYRVKTKLSFKGGPGAGSFSLPCYARCDFSCPSCRGANQLCKLFSGNLDNPSSFLSSTLILVKLSLKTAANLDLISGVLQHICFADLGFLSTRGTVLQEKNKFLHSLTLGRKIPQCLVQSPHVKVSHSTFLPAVICIFFSIRQ